MGTDSRNPVEIAAYDPAWPRTFAMLKAVGDGKERNIQHMMVPARALAATHVERFPDGPT